MDGEDSILVDSTLAIPRAELTWRASRSGGPGGQHVNTSSTRVELTWDVVHSSSLTEEQRQRILERLATRIDGEGVLHLTSSTHRSQARNRDDVTERFRSLLAGALHVQKPRKRTRPSKAAKAARLREKRKRGEAKDRRRPVKPDDD